jgi:hypothetical protein
MNRWQPELRNLWARARRLSGGMVVVLLMMAACQGQVESASDGTASDTLGVRRHPHLPPGAAVWRDYDYLERKLGADCAAAVQSHIDAQGHAMLVQGLLDYTGRATRWDWRFANLPQGKFLADAYYIDSWATGLNAVPPPHPPRFPPIPGNWLPDIDALIFPATGARLINPAYEAPTPEGDYAREVGDPYYPFIDLMIPTAGPRYFTGNRPLDPLLLNLNNRVDAHNRDVINWLNQYATGQPVCLTLIGNGIFSADVLPRRADVLTWAGYDPTQSWHTASPFPCTLTSQQAQRTRPDESYGLALAQCSSPDQSRSPGKWTYLHDYTPIVFGDRSYAGATFTLHLGGTAYPQGWVGINSIDGGGSFTGLYAAPLANYSADVAVEVPGNASYIQVWVGVPETAATISLDSSTHAYFSGL